MLGKTEQEIYKYFTTKDEMDKDSLPIMSANAGTALHRLVQAQQYGLGNIETAEELIYNEKYKFTGHIDAISSTLGIGDIKTVSRRLFKKIAKNGPKASHITQVNAYMMTKGEEKGYIQYVMREDPSQQIVFELDLDEDLFQSDMGKVKRVQDKIRRELDTGKLSYSQMRQGDSLDVLRAEGAKAHGMLQRDSDKIDGLVQNFLYYQNKLNKITGEQKKQKIAFSSRRNEALNPQAKREDMGTIPGLAHGWFGRTRSESTDFGSPYQIGKYHSITTMSSSDIQDLVDVQMGVDFETKGLSAGKGNVSQIAIDYGKGKGRPEKYGSYFLKQKDNNLTEFLEHKSGIGTILKKKLGFDFTKEGLLPDYSGDIFKTEKAQKVKRIHAEVVAEERLKSVLKATFDTAKEERTNILAWNAGFEAEQSKHVLGNNSANLSPAYRKLEREMMTEQRYDNAKLRVNDMTMEEAFDKKVKRQKKVFTQLMDEMEESRTLKGKGYLINPQDAGRMLNAVAQEKGLIKKTGEFGVGTSVELLAKIFLQDTELHEGVSDLAIQNKVTVRTLGMIRDIESGVIDSSNAGGIKGGEGRFLKAFNEDLEATWLKTYERKITSELDAKGHLYDIDPNRRTKLVANSAINEDQIYKKAYKNIMTSSDPLMKPRQEKLTKLTNAIDRVENAGGSTVKGVQYLRTGVAVAGGLAIAVALRNAFKFSGRDDEANTIEGLRHGGLAQAQRKLHTDFGSGFQMEKFHEYKAEDPTDTNYLPLVAFGAVGVGIKTAWQAPLKGTTIADLPYLGRLSEELTNAEVLGREQATIGDAFIAGVKRVEASLGGLPRAFGVSDFLGSPTYASAEFTIDLGIEDNKSYAKYMDSLTRRNLIEEGVDSFTFSKGKITLNKKGVKEVLEGNFDLVRLSADLNQNKSMTQFAKATTRMHGVEYLDPRVNSFIPIGGEGLQSPLVSKLHAYAHETFSKYVHLLDNSLEAFRELFPDAEIPGMGKIRDFTKHVPKLGVGGDAGLLGPTHKVVGKHLSRLGVGGAALYFGYGTLDWAARQIAPDDTAMGDAGLTGLGAAAIRTGHQTYARFSDVIGATSLRQEVREMSPGMEGWQASLGLAFSGGLAGLSLGIAENLTEEGMSAGSHYDKFIEGKKTLEEMPEALRKVPGMTGEYSKVNRYGRMGVLAGLVMSTPWLLSGFGAEKSNAELEEEYEGRKEVEVRRGRYWEASMTPWGGDKIDYYRPNWYARLRDGAKQAELYDGEDISPIGRLVKDLIDPYWLEKRRYEEQPYPYTGPDGSAMSIFGPAYEVTLGRALKAPMKMHEGELNAKIGLDQGKYPVSSGLGGYGADPISANSSQSLIRKQWNSLTEAMGLRGFVAGTFKEKITGEMEMGGYNPELASASDMDSISRSFYDLQIGGGVLTTEALRRILPREHTGSVSKINPLENQMPDWMPREGYHINFHMGDPYAKVKEGYYRMPGEGFSTRYEDLKGVNPDDYPDIYKYKILSDVAPGSNELRKLTQKLERKTLTAGELEIWNQVNMQREERNDSSISTRDPEMYETFLGRYGAIVTDIARANPVEQLTPLSPSHKFLPGQDALSSYEESIYGKSFKRWGSPFEDFVVPAVNMTLNLAGAADVPEEIVHARQLEDHFDKLEYVKNMKHAERARGEGNEGTANFYETQAKNTMSGLDPYSDSKALMGMIPKRERGYFKKFLNAPSEDRNEILSAASPAMRDVYMAQWDKQALDSLESGEAEIYGEEREEMVGEIKARAAQVRGRRQAQTREFMNSGKLPGDEWTGWDRRADLEDVKMKYLINEGRDYHHYGLWRDRLNLLGRKPYINAAAENLNFRPETYENKYSGAYEQARSMGVVDPRISIMPGLETGVDLELQQDRRQERINILRDLGHVL